MYELVPSKTMREYLASVDFKFNDFQRAALIWNKPDMLWKERLEAIEKLADTTKDEDLKRQIKERVQFEKREWSAFLDNVSGGYVYIVEDHEDVSCNGVFAEYNKAYIYSLKYASNYDTSCLIKKYRIVKNAEDEIVRTSERGNPYMGIEIPEFCEYDGTEVSGVSFNKKGEITRIWSNELTKEEEEIVSSYRPERFEFPFIKIPFDMPVGSIVKEVTTGTYGVLSQGKKDWDDYLKRIEDRKWYVYFSDIQVMVYELTESGCWSHNHMNPLYLQLEEPEHIPGDEENQTFISAMKAFGNYLQSEDEEKVMKGQAVIQTAREYAEIKRCKEWQTRNLNEAMKPEDIMF